MDCLPIPCSKGASLARPVSTGRYIGVASSRSSHGISLRCRRARIRSFARVTRIPWLRHLASQRIGADAIARTGAAKGKSGGIKSGREFLVIAKVDHSIAEAHQKMSAALNRHTPAVSFVHSELAGK